MSYSYPAWNTGKYKNFLCVCVCSNVVLLPLKKEVSLFSMFQVSQCMNFFRLSCLCFERVYFLYSLYILLIAWLGEWYVSSLGLPARVDLILLDTVVLNHSITTLSHNQAIGLKGWSCPSSDHQDQPGPCVLLLFSELC